MNIILFLYIVNVLLYKKCFTDEQKFILLPFSFQKEKSYSSKEYNIEIFIRNNFYKNITFDFYIGNPPQKSEGVIINDNLCFELKKEEDLYSYNNFFNYINNKYRPKDSSTFSVINKELRWEKGTYMILGSELFKFENNNEYYNLSFLFQKTNEENISIDEIQNQKYIVKFGVNALSSFSGDECPNFMSTIRNKAHLNKYLISYAFTSSDKGYLVIGDELYNYDKKKYHESQYKAVYYSIYYSLNHHKEIVVDINNNRNITLNLTYAVLQYDLGVIIGTSGYKKIIDELFFNKYISKNICQINTLNLNVTDNYYIYTCNQNNFDIKQFPKIIFSSRSYNFEFELNYNDLFVKKYNNKYYFLVLFKAYKEENNTNNTDIKEIWIMGEPFYKKYDFTLNIEGRMLGFYNPNYDYEEEKEIVISKNKKFNYMIVYVIFGIIILLVLMLLSFYLGMKIKKERKQRANELKEDNYEYVPENTNDENKLIN